MDIVGPEPRTKVLSEEPKDDLPPPYDEIHKHYIDLENQATNHNFELAKGFEKTE